jgi:hypothetical protein
LIGMKTYSSHAIGPLLMYIHRIHASLYRSLSGGGSADLRAISTL